MTTIDTQLPAALGKSHQSFPRRDRVTAALESFSAMVITLMDWQDRARQQRQLLGPSDGAL